MKTLYLECNMGAAGDMLLSALYELLDADKKAIFLKKMNGILPGVTLAAQSASTCGIAGTHMTVTVNGTEEESLEVHHGHHKHDHGHKHEHKNSHHKHTHDHNHDHDHGHEHKQDHHHATPGHIAELIDTLPLPETVRTHARKVYDAIALAEAQAHGCPVGDVHFHEVGALDAVADVTGVCYALHLLGAEQMLCSPIHVGSGQVQCAHGIVPVPAPATATLLTGIPCYGGAIQGELCTPTGAALLAHFALSFGPMPVMAIARTGYGIGKKEFEAANCVRAFLGETVEGAGEITELVCNLDDMTPEALSFATARLLELGALDVYTVPGQMKKGRPGWELTVLCTPGQEEALSRQIFAHTTTNGLRTRSCGKYFLAPSLQMIETTYGSVRIKRAEGFGVCHCKPEYDDVAALAQAQGLPFAQVWAAAIAASENVSQEAQ